MNNAQRPKGLDFKDYEGADYEAFWRGAAKHQLDKMERAVVSDALPRGRAIADIGAGFGRLGDCYVDKFETVHMVEPASNLRESAEKLWGDRIKTHDASVYQLPFRDGELDAVLMVRVFHHLGEPQRALAEIHRVLSPGGILVFNFSNKRNPARILRYLLRQGPNPFSHEMEEYAPTLLGHHPQVVRSLLDETGFDLLDAYGVGIEDKLVQRLPGLKRIMPTSTTMARLAARLHLAPTEFLRARKRGAH